MTARDPEDKTGYWENELNSLGIDPKRKNELNSVEELEALADNIKRVYYQNFKSAYSENGSDKSRFDYVI